MKIAAKSRNKQDVFVIALTIYFLCLPFGAMEIGNANSLLKFVALIPVAVFLMQRPEIRITKMFCWQALYFLWLVISFAFAISTKKSAQAIITQLSFLVLLFAVSGYTYDEKQVALLKSALVWSSRLTAAITLLFGGFLEGRLTLTGVITEDPNYLCAYFMFGVIDVMITLFSSDGKRKLLRLLELFAYIYIIVYTGSRGGSLAVLFGLAVIWVFYKEKKSGVALSAKKMFALLVLAAIAAIALSLLPENILSRFTWKTIIASKGEQRLRIWKNGLHVFSESSVFRKLIGYGPGCVTLMFKKFGFDPRAMHNVFLQVMAESGVVGLILYSTAIISFFKHAVKSRDSFAVAVMSGMIVLSMSTSIMAFKPYWNILIMIVCIMLKNDSLPSTDTTEGKKAA